MTESRTRRSPSLSADPRGRWWSTGCPERPSFVEITILHQHKTQDGRRGSSTPSCQAFRRGRGARRPARTSSRAARRPAGAKRPWLGGEAGRAPGWEPAAEAPGAAGPTTRRASLRQRPPRLPGAPAARPVRAGGSGGRPGAGVGCRRPGGVGRGVRTR